MREVSKTENSRIGKVNKDKSGLFEKLDKINKPLARLIKKISIKNDGGDVNTNTIDIKITRDQDKQFYDGKFNNLGAMDIFLEKHSLSNWLKEKEKN